MHSPELYNQLIWYKTRKLQYLISTRNLKITFYICLLKQFFVYISHFKFTYHNKQIM